VTALSFHACPYVADKYLLLPHGASFGDGYGPLLVANSFTGGEPHAWLAGKTIAVPGLRTSAFLALKLFAAERRRITTVELMAVREGNETPPPLPAQGGGEGGIHFDVAVAPFDQIIPRVAAGEFDGGLIIHEGQLTYHEDAGGRLKKVVDLGAWWTHATGLPLPLGGNAIRRDLGPERIRRISRHLRQSIEWALAHRAEALGYALRYARNLGRDQADKFVGMYVNSYTLDYGEKGRAAVRLFLSEGRHLGLIRVPVRPEWSE
jgi:1,4-dihydroxy-6-naphthoate synthase